jgi:arabinogalactan oligomer/maltooligosaccharide transport system substrate-binding protein
MKKNLFLALVVVTLFSMLAACGAAPEPTAVPVVQPTAIPSTAVPPTAVPPTVPPTPVTIVLWTKEGEADGGLQFVKSLTDAYTALYPNVTFEVVNKDVESLREDFQNASLAGSPPDLLWTVNDHAGPFVTADLIQPVDDLVDLSLYVESVKMNGKTWAVPISSGNHLMFIYNKALMPTPPANTDELLALAGTFGPDIYPLVYNQTEPFWMVPWLGGFGGKVFEDDGVTPSLNTPEMIATLQFLADLKGLGVVPLESDYNGADSLFKEGKAAAIINGDWSLGGYKSITATTGLLPENLGVARIPMVSSTGLYPAPYTSGTYFMVPKGIAADRLAVVKDFIAFATNKANQVNQIATLSRLPGLKEVANDPAITSDPILKGSADQMVVGTPMPSVLEMRCNWDSMKPEMLAVLAGTTTPDVAAANMQTAAEACIVK